MTCGYCDRRCTKQDAPVFGVFQVYPPPAKPCCGRASCLAAAKADSER